MRMPGLNGLETYRELKKIQISVKVIIMTAYSMEETLKKAEDEGVRSIIYKPFQMTFLIDLITSVTSSES